MIRSGGRGAFGLVLSGLVLAILACNGGAAAPTAAPLALTDIPTVIAENTATAATETTAPTEVPTEAPSETPSPEPTALDVGSSKVSDSDGITQMYVPAGDFLMGADAADAFADDDERPQHTVTLDAFWIDQTEVTNAMYAMCVAAGDCLAPELIDSATRPDYYENPDYADFPVMHVAWEEAAAYCGWAGRRLPSEAEWEKAARGTDGRLYPWGNAEPDSDRLNFDQPEGDTTAVGSYPDGASPFGALDMAGNLYEWVADWYSATYYAELPAENPTGPVSDADERHGVRGGYWGTSAPYVRVTERDGQSFNRPNWLGFRCAENG